MMGIPLPKCLKRPLVFGDREQIEALRAIAIEQEIKDQEKHTRDLKNGVIKKYDVTIKFSGQCRDRIFATSKKEAEEMARRIDVDPYDYDIDDIYVREIV